MISLSRGLGTFRLRTFQTPSTSMRLQGAPRMSMFNCPPSFRRFSTEPNTTNVNNTTENEAVKEEEDLRKDLSHRIKALEKHIEDSAKHLEETKKELLITLADAETTRRIAKKDVDLAKAFGIQSFATSLLDISDNLRLALESVSKETLANNPQAKALYDGVEMTEKLMLKTFSKFEIQKLHPLGEKFDPKHHQGLVEIQDPTKEPGTIAYVMKSGYKLKDRVLRPAAVGVVKAPAKPETKEEEKKEDSEADKKIKIVDVE